VDLRLADVEVSQVIQAVVATSDANAEACFSEVVEAGDLVVLNSGEGILVKACLILGRGL